MNYYHYLRGRSLSKETAKIYQYIITQWKKYNEAQRINVEEVTTADILKYIDHLRAKNNATRTIAQNVSVIKKYLNYRLENYNPAEGIKMQGMPKNRLRDYLTEIELLEIYQSVELKKGSDLQYKVMLGLIMFQGARTGEVKKLKSYHLDLELRWIKLPQSRKSVSRKILIQENQKEDLKSYLEMREKKENRSENLFLSIKGKENLNNTFSHLLRRIRKEHPEIKNLDQLRSSRIHLWLKNHNLRQVQQMAGHRYVSSTEAYKGEGLENLQSELDRLNL